MFSLENFWKKDKGNTQKTPSLRNLQIGDKIGPEPCYEILQILGGEGRTGMGIVFICYGGYGPKEDPKNYYALKTFQDKCFRSNDNQSIFEREALVWVNLDKSPYIVQAKWVNRIEDRLFIVMEYIVPDKQGRNNLTHYLGNLTLPEILKYSIQFCDGMEYGYSKGIDAHRDIKPDNIMITSGGTLKITDFGLAKVLQEMDDKENNTFLTEGAELSVFKSKTDKRVCGTLPYMSPEQFDGYADKRSDIYAFGVTLYQMVTGGQLPFVGKGKTIQEIQTTYEKLHKYENPPVITSSVFYIIQKCLEKDPNKRYQDFFLLREQLQLCLLKETEETFMPQSAELNVIDLQNKGVSLSALGKYQEAIVCFDRAIKLVPEFHDAWCSKGYALGNLSRYQEAIVCFDKAIELTPNWGPYWFNKGKALEHLSKHQEASVCYNKAREIDDKHIIDWSNKALALQNCGKYEEAARWYGTVLNKNPNSLVAKKGKEECLKKLGSK